ncbi:MAG: hypothetical protein AB4062_13470 [Crocosphaera sp.]
MSVQNALFSVVEKALESVFELLQEFASTPLFEDKVETAFGEGVDLSGFQTAWLNGEFEDFPEIEIRSAAEINGAYGAFSDDTDKIYLAQEFIEANIDNPDAIVKVLLEEYGHFVDSEVNDSDAVGDEGDIFARLVLGETLSTETLAQLKAEDDSVTIVLDGEEIAIEQSWNGIYFQVNGTDGNDSLEGGNRQYISGTSMEQIGTDPIGNPVYGPVPVYSYTENEGFMGGLSDDTIYGNDGDDILNGDGGNDFLDGGTGNDTLNGGSGEDSLLGQSGHDSLNGGDNNDSLNGGSGTDFLDGGSGSDLLYGQHGDDILMGGLDNDTLIGGEGNDTYIFDADVNSGTYTISEHIIALKTHHGRYLQTQDAASNYEVSQQTVLEDWEQFTVIGTGTGEKIGLHTYHNRFLQALDSSSAHSSGTFDVSQQTVFENWEQFTVEQQNDGKIALKTHHDKYLMATGNDTQSSNSPWEIRQSDSVGDLEKFIIETTQNSGMDILDFSSTTTKTITIDLSNHNQQQVSDNLSFIIDSHLGSGIENIIGGSLNDSLTGNNLNNALIGGKGNDTIDGGNGHDFTTYKGKSQDYIITYNEGNGTWTVQDNKTDDYDEGTDTLISVEQILFEGDRTRTVNDYVKNTIYAVAGVHEAGEDTSHKIKGGDAKATNFIIDIEGSTGLGLNFDTTKLANFINDITLPNQEIEKWRLWTNVALELAQGTVSAAMPIKGDLYAGSIGVMQALANYGFDIAQVFAQKQAARDAINNSNYNTSAWGTITQTNRDLVVIEDFQIGMDTIFLPSVKDIQVNGVESVGYAIKSGTLNSNSGVWIEAQIGDENANLAFIVNKYGNDLSNTDFADIITNLFRESVIGTFNGTPIKVDPNSSGRENKAGTYANDHIYGLTLSNSTFEGQEGSFELIGKFGDDLVEGNKGQDILWGGFNTDEIPTFDNLTYEDDGFDILRGGEGDDTLYGGTGNDILDGGGYNYINNELELQEIIINDGTDTLTGGFGNDTFVFNTRLTGTDTITDFGIYQDTILINLDKDEIGNSVNLSYTYSGTDLTLSIANTPIAKLQGISQSHIPTVFKRIEFISHNNSLQDTEGTDIAILDNENNNFFGKGGDDWIYGGDGNDTLAGGLGNDIMIGGDGNDDFNGQENDDIMIGGYGADIFRFDGTSIVGSDRILDFTATEGDQLHLEVATYNNPISLDYTYSGTNLSLSMSGHQFVTLENIAQSDVASVFKRIAIIDNSGSETESNDILVGGNGNDAFFGKGGDDWIDGGDGNDDLRGGFGNDIMIGGDGNDTLTGHENDDTLIGGYGADIFYFASPSRLVGSDTILDFTANESDRIEIAKSAYGISSLAEVTFESSTGKLLVTGHTNPIATLENQSGFDVNSHVVLV